MCVPYSVYLLFGDGAAADASVKGTSAHNARVMVNYLVAILIGGPQMYAALTRTIMDRDPGWSNCYMICLSMLPVSGMLILAGTRVWPDLHGDMSGSDEACTYMGILSILLVHYVHDALLFTDHDAIVSDSD